MRSPYSAVDRFDDGFRCAYFFHYPDRPLVLAILFRALDDMNVQTLGLKNKLDSSRRLSRKSGQAVQIKKLSLSGPQLFQYLILQESTQVERHQEAAADSKLREEDLLIRYIKHAVLAAWRRLSFHMAVALWRVIHNYRTEHLRTVDEFLTGEAKNSFADDCRRAKKDLMQSLQLRFGNHLELVELPGKEQRFRGRNWSSHRGLIHQCLDLLTPWGTPCVFADDLGDAIFVLKGERKRPSDHEQVERNRIHSHLHPDCFARLTEINGLLSLGDMLDLPGFTRCESSGPAEPSGGRRPIPHLNDDEIADLKKKLAAMEGRRRASSPRILKVVVDGEHRANIYLGGETTLTIPIQNGAQLLKVYAPDGAEDLLLATHLIDYEDDGSLAAAHAMVRLPGGKRIQVVVSPDPGGAGAGASATVTYQLRFFSSFLAATRQMAGSPLRTTSLVPTVVLMILALLGAAIFMMRHPGPQPPAPITEAPQRPPAIPPQAPDQQPEPDAAGPVLAYVLVKPYTLAGEPSTAEPVPDGPGRVELQFSIPAGETRFTSYRVLVKNGAEIVADGIATHKMITLDGKRYRVVPVLLPAGIQREERLEAWVSGRRSGHDDELLEVYSLRLTRNPK